MATEKRVTEVVAEVAAVEVKAPESFDLTLNEFCLRLSAEKVSPEMIAGFQYSQLEKKVVKASQAAFKTAFDKFVRQPA